jgi:hypothetical protein
MDGEDDFDMEAMLEMEQEVLHEQEEPPFDYDEEFAPNHNNQTSSSSDIPPSSGIQNPFHQSPTTNHTLPVPSVVRKISPSDSSKQAKQLLNKQLPTGSHNNNLPKIPKITASELARSIKAERDLARGKDVTTRQAQPTLLFDNCSKLIVFQENLFRISDERVKGSSNLMAENYLEGATNEKACSCTLLGGKRFFLKDREIASATDDDEKKLDFKGQDKQDSYMKQLLLKSIDRIMEEGDELMIKKMEEEKTRKAAVEEERKKKQSISEPFDEDLMETTEEGDHHYHNIHDETTNETTVVPLEESHKNHNNSLWVDKYAPKTFTQVIQFFFLSFVFHSFKIFFSSLVVKYGKDQS